jgi:pSer/pThr/pTyr-binding forkhead associated (FHA) protein
MVTVATQRLVTTEWTEILALMTKPEPYAYLELISDGGRESLFGLENDEVIVGRSPDDCQVVIPDRYTRASRVHTRITRLLSSTVIDDMDSKHGTFINRESARTRRKMEQGQVIFRNPRCYRAAIP